MSSCHQIWVWAVYKHLLALRSFKPAFSLGFFGEHHLDTRVVHVQNGWTLSSCNDDYSQQAASI